MKIAWATKIGDEPWQEILLTEVEERIPAATEWAEANGYTVRIADVDLTAVPDFGKTVQTRERR